MTTTNWNHCFSLLLVLGLLGGAAAPAAALSVVDEDVPQEAQVGTQVSATVTLDELYQDPQLAAWQLTGETELRNVSWRVELFDQTGARVDQVEATGQNLSGVGLSADDGISEVTVTVTGTVPDVQNFTYEPRERFLLVSLTQAQEGGVSNDIESRETHHYTNASRSAREALDAANESIATAEGANPAEARETFDSAVDAYEGGNFDNAERLANRAEEQATEASESQQTQQTLFLAGGGVVVLLLLVGGVYYWRSQQDSYDKLG